MKKTIAILLVLVIGMVGVFAGGDPPTANETSTMKIKAVIDSINEMVALNTEADAPELGATTPWAGTHNGATISGIGETHIGNLYTRSNNAAGYEVKMTAGPLKTDGDLYLAYVVKAYKVEGETDVEKGKAAYAITDQGSDGETDSIIKVTTLAGLAMETRKIKVTIADYLSARAGEYNATITFEYFGS